MNILNQILEVKKEEVSALKKIYSLNSFREMEFFNEEPLRLRTFINRNDHIAIIAEIKKASPSKGIIREDFNHLKIADIYFEQDLDAVSILTDKNFFKGDIQFLKDIARIKQVPLLRKDFIIDEFQVFESKANGADTILLISEALSKNQIADLTYAAEECGLDVLLELHSENQLEKIDFDVNKIIGINNRSLEDFTINLQTTTMLSEKIPNEVTLVAESGISNKDDIDFLKKAKIDAILVGEHLMASKDIKSKLSELKEWCQISQWLTT